MKNKLWLSIMPILLNGCIITERLSNIGDPPEISQIQNPTQMDGYRPVSMPMPQTEPQEYRQNSLWESGAKAFFKDQRAHQVGDLVIVQFTIANENVDMKATATHKKDATSDSLVNQFFGLDRQLDRILPIPVYAPGTRNGSQLLSTTSHGELTGNGEKKRTNNVNFRLAATIIQILPNGNLVIQGRQEFRVDGDTREIALKGIIRREDIGANNTVLRNKIAHARVTYGGRGDISDMMESPLAYETFYKATPF